MTIAMALLENS